MRLNKIIFGLIALTATLSVTQAALISYNLSMLDNTTDNAQYNTTMTYPDAYAGGFIMKDPSDDVGYMGRMGKSQFTSESATMIQRYSSADSYIYAKASNVGFTGADVLSTGNYSNTYISVRTSGGQLYQTTTNIYWYAQNKGQESDNQTAFNDVAYGFRLTDTDGDGNASAGDVLELVGIVYSTGTDSVFGQTADQLMRVVIPEPATIGMLGFGAVITLLVRRRRFRDLRGIFYWG